MKTENKYNENDFYIVGVGASAGGLDAIQVLFDNLPADTGMSFVIVQHLSPTFKSLMDELLAKHTDMPITLASDGIELKPNHIYLNPKEKNIVYRNGKIEHLDKDTSYPLNLPIDIFFHSLGNELDQRAIGIILSGTGSDGSRGISTIKESGGTVIVQDPSSAQFDGMPITAINSKFADYVLKPDKIGDELVRISGSPKFVIQESENEAYSPEDYFKRIIEILTHYSEIDFGFYKPNTIIRRIEKRINIKQLTSLEEYYDLIKNNTDEQKTLFKECLIGVTAFFRDQEAFHFVKEFVFPAIFKSQKTKMTTRFWVAGCSTGEEAYSLAIIIDEYLRENDLVYDYKIFATDADSRALQIASLGQYPVNLISDIEKDRLERYFIKSGNRFEILKRLREKIVFSTHNILNDPPFIRMDFISCRNLLIYMNNKSQRKIINTFRFSLNLNGFLFLGNSENINEIKGRFDIVDAKWRIYKNISENSAYPSQFTDSKLGSYSIKNPYYLSDTLVKTEKAIPENLFNRSIAEIFGPTCIYIDDKLNVLFLNGDVSEYLSFSRGMLKQNLIDMIPNEKLQAMIRNGLRRLREEKKNIVFKKFEFENNGDKRFITLKFASVNVESFEQSIYVIVFEKADESGEDEVVYDHFKIDEFTKHRIDDLERELKAAKEETQNVIEELETSNEELQASNEELQASNEELQSTNEELQSVNEELYTINSELQNKNKELFDLNNDLSNVLNNTNIALLFLDKDLKIRMFTPELKRIFNLEKNDIDRPINSFASNFVNIAGKELAEDVIEVISSLKTHSKELVSEDNRIYLNRISPYKTIDGKVEGAVIAFMDITDVRKKDLEIQKNNRILELATSVGNLAWWDWDFKTGELIYSDAKATMLGYTSDELGNTAHAFNKLIHPDDSETAAQAMKDLISGKKEMYEVEYRIKKKDGTYSWFYDKGGIIAWDEENKPLRITGLVIDISESRRREDEIYKLFKAFLQTPIPNLITDLNGVIEFVNESHCVLTGYSAEELIGRKTNIFKSGKHSKKFYANLWKTIKSKNVWHGELANKMKNGEIVWEQSTISPLLNERGEVINFMKVSQDATPQIEAKEKLKNDKLKAEESDKLKSAFLANMSHEIRTPMNAIVGFGQLLEAPSLDDEKRIEFTSIINSQGEYLLTLINDIIDISKIEAGAISLRNEVCDLDKLFTELLAFFRLSKSDKIAIDFFESEKIENFEIHTDGTRLKQVLMNLIGNAVKFTQKGKVEFGVDLISEDELQFFVNDTGPGIKNSKLDQIFDRFYQVDSENVELQHRGTGLGLAITKALVELLGGKIWVVSDEYVGSTFYFTVPYKPVINSSSKLRIKPSEFDGVFTDRKILVVEDMESNYLFVNYALKKTNAVITWAKNGKQAVELVKLDNDFDLILMDVSMPILNGYSATQKIRQIDKTIPIIAMTAFAMEGDSERAVDAGCTDYISKPIKIDDLISIINKNLSMITN